MKWCINKRHVDLCRKYTNMHVKTARGNGSRMVEKILKRRRRCCGAGTGFGYSAYVLRTIQTTWVSAAATAFFGLNSTLFHAFSMQSWREFSISQFCVCKGFSSSAEFQSVRVKWCWWMKSSFVEKDVRTASQVIDIYNLSNKLRPF